MVRHISVWGLALLVALLFLRGQVAADERPGKHTHDEKAPQGQTMEGHTTPTRPRGSHPPPRMRTPGARAGAIRRRFAEGSRSSRPTAWSATAPTARGRAQEPWACRMPRPTSRTTFTGPLATGMRISSGG